MLTSVTSALCRTFSPLQLTCALLPLPHGPPCSDVASVAGRAALIEREISAGNPSVAAFAGKEVIPVFMAGACVSWQVDEEVQETCNRLGVVRYGPNGAALSVQA